MLDGGAFSWLERNVQKNRCESQPLKSLGLAAFDWNWIDPTHRPEMDEPNRGDDMARILGSSWDIILGSDLVYNEAGVDMLPKVLAALLDRGHDRTYALYAHTLNRFEFLDRDFFENMAECRFMLASCLARGRRRRRRRRRRRSAASSSPR